MKIAFLTTDNREHYRAYGETLPHFASGLYVAFPRVWLFSIRH